MALQAQPSEAINSGILEQLHAKFPPSVNPDPSSPITKGFAALERRTSNRSASGANGRTSTLHGQALERSRTASPSMGFGIDANGIRSTASSPGLPKTQSSKRAPPPAPLLRTKMRPPSELFLPTPRTGQMTGFRFSALIPEDSVLPSPDVPLRAATTAALPASTSAWTAPPPMSPISASLASAIARLDVNASVQTMFDNLGMPEATRFTFPPIRSSTAPPGLRRQPSFLSIKSTKSFLSMRSARSLPLRSFSTTSGKKSVGSIKTLSPRLKQFSGIDKDVKAEKRIGAIKAKNRLSMIEDGLASPTEDKPARPVMNKAATFSVIPWRRKKRGETMSMLLDTGFFPVSEYIYNPEKDAAGTKRSPTKRGKLALEILIKDLPAGRPSSILMTPTNFYSGSSLAHRRSTRGGLRRSIHVRRKLNDTRSLSISSTAPSTIISQTITMAPLTPSSPTSPLTPSKALAALTSNLLLPPTPPTPNTPRSGQPSPGILEVIPEDNNNPNPFSTPPSSIPEEIATTTEIHLNTGTTLTIKPPEFTAWRRSLYLQGPIKLPTPLIMPRKNSIATLDPFQEVILTEPIPRRKSEDAVVEDICTWYSRWSFSAVSFAHDTFEQGEEGIDGVLKTLAEEPESPMDTDFRFSSVTLPLAPSPVAAKIALAMMGDSVFDGSASKTTRESFGVPLVPLPELPKEGSEDGASSKRDSGGSSGGSSGWTDAKSRPGSRGSGVSGVSVEEQGWDESKGKRGSEGGFLKAKPKMSRMRRYLQTASAIL